MKPPVHTPAVQAKMIVLVNRYFTPFAMMLVGIGLALSQPQGWVGPICVGLLVFAGIFNAATARSAGSRGEASQRLSLIRLATNLGMNVVLVYLLGGYWTPIWLLFVLTPVATAVYGSRNRTIGTSVGVSGLLVATHAARRLNAPVDWGQALVQAGFIVFLALFVNELVEVVRDAERAGGH